MAGVGVGGWGGAGGWAGCGWAGRRKQQTGRKKSGERHGRLCVCVCHEGGAMRTVRRAGCRTGLGLFLKRTCVRTERERERERATRAACGRALHKKNSGERERGKRPSAVPALPLSFFPVWRSLAWACVLVRTAHPPRRRRPVALLTPPVRRSLASTVARAPPPASPFARVPPPTARASPSLFSSPAPVRAPRPDHHGVLVAPGVS